MTSDLKFAGAALLALLAATTASGKSAPGPAAAAAVPNVERGADLFVTVGCYQCHGLAAHGGVAPKLGPDAWPAFAIAAYIRNPTGVMPPYAETVLSDADVADIAAWLRTVPESPDAAAISILPPVSDIDGTPRIR